MALEITVISAKHLKNVNWRNGDLSPYAVVSLDNNPSLSTKPDLSGSTRPVWNERLLLPLSNNSHSPHFLALEVFHSSQPDIPVGSVRVPIYGFDDPSRIRTLELRRPSGRPHGKIRVKLGFIATPPPLPLQDYRFAPSVSDCYSFTPPPAVSGLVSPPRGISPQVRDCYYVPGVSCNYDSTPLVSDCYNSAPPVFNCHNPTHPALSGILSPQEISPQVQDCHFSPGVLFNYDSTPPVSNCYSYAPSVSNCYNSSLPVSLPPQRFSGQVQDHDFTASVLGNYDSATAPPVPRLSPPTQRPGSWKPSGQSQDYEFRPPILCNYDSATPPVFPCVIRPPPPQQSASLQVKDYTFSPLFPYNYDSATAPLAASPLPPRQSSGQAQYRNFSPPVSCNYDSATVTGSLPPKQSYEQAQDYNFSPPVSCNYNSATAPLASSPPPPRQSSPQAQEYSFSPPVSCNYDSATVIGSLPAQQSSGQVQDYNFSSPASCKYDIATAPPVPSPPPPQQSGSLPAQQSSGQSQDYNFTPLVSYNYNSATATQPRQQTYPPPQPESGMLPPPEHTSPQAQDYSFAPPSLRNYDTAPPPACPFPMRPRPPQQYAYRQGYENDYQKSLRPNCSGEQPSAPVDYNGDSMNVRGCFGDEVALARAMKRMVLVESDLGSQSGDSEYSRSYSAQPSAPVMKGSDDYGMF